MDQYNGNDVTWDTHSALDTWDTHTHTHTHCLQLSQLKKITYALMFTITFI